MIRGVTLITVAFALMACGSHPTQLAQQPTPVRVQSATSGPASPTLETNGFVATKDELRLSFKVSGVIKSINVEAGQTVKPGQRLAEIELTEIDAQVAQAQALADKAERDLARGERLYKDEVISLEQLQDLRTQASLQHAQLTGAQFNRGYSVITAPQGGVILRKLSQVRELIPAGQPVLVIGARDRGYVVRAALSDREVVQLKLGDRAQIRMDAYPDRAIGGTISEIANAADEKSGLFPVEVRFDSIPVALASGLVAKLRIFPASAQAKTLTYVPVSAIVEGDGKRASVFVVEGDHVKRRSVQVSFIESKGVALSEGLAPGERVVTDGALYLQDNDRIAVVRDATKVIGTLAVDAG
ncbi:MAG TPA: efflux RND transporter periplasmic adaptor subunit [Steroidobacteraceae bacterium]|jgi:RND family efflux transporter MFP subunit